MLQGYAYVNYSTAEIASEAVAQLNGVEVRLVVCPIVVVCQVGQ